MKPKRARVPSAALALPLFLALSIQAIPSLPSTPRQPQLPPAPQEDLSRRQLAALLGGRSMARLGAGAVSPADLSAALGAPPRRFGLFRADSAVDGRRELLRRIPFGAILAAAGERNRVDSLLLAAMVESESQFAPHAVSPCGAVGLMQLLPSTGKDYGVKDLRDPYANVDAGSRYLRVLLNRFKQRPDLAIAAYNTGPEVIARYGCVPPFRETQEFVKRVLTTYARHRQELARASAPPPKAHLLLAAAAGPSHADPPPQSERESRTR
jgi:soluble lytic murein transglycosylase-like protein